VKQARAYQTWWTLADDGETMNQIEIDARTDDTGNLLIRLPGARPHHLMHVRIEWEEPLSTEQVDWPSDWFAATAGTIDDPSFVRSPELEHEVRDEF
jgi:hypothetical protein